MSRRQKTEDGRQKVAGRKRIARHAYYLLLPAACFALLLSAAPCQAETANRIVAIVNEEVITEGDVLFHMSEWLQEGDPPARDDARGNEMRQAVLRRLIEERLIAQEAKRMKLAVGSDEVAERLRSIRERLETQEAYEQMLREASLSEEQLKQEIREQLLAQKAIDRQVRSTIMVSPYELAKASASATVPNPGEEVRASHLLIRVGDARPAAHAFALITQLHERLRRGEAFETLAREYSDDPHAEAGGALGWVRQGELLPELDEAIFRLKAGELSEPIQTRLGFHLVKVLERRSVSELDAAEAHQRLAQRVYQAKFAEALTKWLEELKQHAYIQILEE